MIGSINCVEPSVAGAPQAHADDVEKRMTPETVFSCPNKNCDYHGKPGIQKYGNLLLAFVLMLLFLIPGFVYWILGTGVRYICPKCGMHLGKA